MIVLEWLFLTIAPCDTAEPWQLGSQDAATPMILVGRACQVKKVAPYGKAIC